VHFGVNESHLAYSQPLFFLAPVNQIILGPLTNGPRRRFVNQTNRTTPSQECQAKPGLSELISEKWRIHELFDALRTQRLQEREQRTRPAAKAYSGMRMSKA
jgi:hypothetical protein